MNRTISMWVPLVLLVAGCSSFEGRVDNDVQTHAQEVLRLRMTEAAQRKRSTIKCDPSANHESNLWDNTTDGLTDRRVDGERSRLVAFLNPDARWAADSPSDQELIEANPSTPKSDSPATQPAAIERGPLPGFRETLKRDLKAAPRVLWEDTKSVYTDPFNLVFLLGAGGISGALRPEVDDDIEDYYDRHHSMKEDWRDAFGAAGSPITHFALASTWYLVGQQFQDDKTYEVGKQAISALTITGMTTVLLKLAANTDSPNGEEWAWPSGHVSSTMALATVANDAYGPLVGIPMFGLTGLVALERMDSGEHHFSDVVFGAALGWVVAETVMKKHRPEVFGGELVPYVNATGNAAGIAWIKVFDE